MFVPPVAGKAPGAFVTQSAMPNRSRNAVNGRTRSQPAATVDGCRRHARTKSLALIDYKTKTAHVRSTSYAGPHGYARITAVAARVQDRRAWPRVRKTSACRSRSCRWCSPAPKLLQYRGPCARFVCTSSRTMRDTARHKDNAGMEPSISRDERVARGTSARTKVPRSSHAELRLSNRRDPLKLLEEQAKTRLPKLLPIRYGRMARSPFGFVRGAAVVMVADLATTPTTGIRAQLCGDAHLKNFGLFATPERNLVFDANDFDETLPGPWEWDLKRLVASVELAGREDGFSSRDRRGCVLDVARAYREAMAEFAQQRKLEVWYAHLDAAAAMDEYQRLLDRKLLERKEQAIAKARQRDSMHAFERLTELVHGQRRIISRPPLLVPVRELVNQAERHRIEHELTDAIDRYAGTLSHERQTLLRQFQFVELAHRVVGVGSVATRCWIGLFVGSDSNDPLVLQIKEAQSSVLEPFAGASMFANHGERVVRG